MYNELIKQLRHPWEYNGLISELTDSAADAIEELSKVLDTVNDAHNEGYDVGYWVGRQDYEPQWIPVTERLLDYPGRFICYYEIDDCGEVGHCIDWGRYDEDDGWYVSGVTYWMPLPEPLKEES